MTSRRLIALETSGRSASVALATLSEDGRLADVHQRDLSQTGRRHARTLVPELQSLLSEHGFAPADCEAVAVTLGPGSFTGLRVGVACAKTLAWAAGLKIVGVGTLEVIARQSNASDAVVLANAEREQLFVATLSGGRLGPRTIEDEDALFARLPADAVLTGVVPPAVRERNAGRNWLSPERGHPQAATLVALAAEALAAGRTDDPYTLLPDYGRLSAAEEQRAEKMRQAEQQAAQ